MNLQTLQTNFERELLFQIIARMREQRLSKGRAKNLAKAFLPTLESIDTKEFIDKNSRLCEFYPEIMEAFIVTIKEYEKVTTEEKIGNTRSSLKGGEK